MKKTLFIAIIGIFTFALVACSSEPTTTSSTSGRYIETVSEEQAQSIDEILESCGVTGITSITHDELLDDALKDGDTGYRIECDRADNVILYLAKNGKVRQLKYADHKLYAKGKVKASLVDYTVDVDEANDLIIFCEEQVKSILASPNTAQFPSITEWGFDKTDKHIIVQGYVDATNALGGTVQSTFQFKIGKKSHEVKSFIFDGEELAK